MIARLKALWASYRASSSTATTDTPILRLVRPTAFLLLVVMFVIGWRHPDQLSAFADAISKLPDHLWVIVDILMGSIAGTKLVRDLKG